MDEGPGKGVDVSEDGDPARDGGIVGTTAVTRSGMTVWPTFADISPPTSAPTASASCCDTATGTADGAAKVVASRPAPV
jgi:hypothetical protein